MKKNIKKYRPFQSWQFEDHAEWLVAMSREGWHYKGQDFIGLQHFEPGAPAEMEYCWDKTPRASEEASRYRQQCRENGWELACNVGRWLCWTRAVAAHETRAAPRHQQRTRALCQKNVRHHWVMAVLTMLAFALLLAADLAKPPALLRWSDLQIVVLLLFAMLSVRDALRARSRVRVLAQST